jgi:hypothetical protein
VREGVTDILGVIEKLGVTDGVKDIGTFPGKAPGIPTLVRCN